MIFITILLKRIFNIEIDRYKISLFNIINAVFRFLANKLLDTYTLSAFQ